MLKRCFHFTHCPLESRCELAHVDIKHGQFQPEYVGENCHHFKPLVDCARKWGVGPDLERSHVYPLNDLREHNTNGLDCWCHPEFDEEDNVVIHNAADRREAFETGEGKPS